MESGRQSSNAFHKSNSSPNIHIQSLISEVSIKHDDNGDLSRSASFTSLSSIGLDMASTNGYLDAEVNIRPLDTPGSLSRRSSIDGTEVKTLNLQGKGPKAQKSGKSRMSGWMGKIIGKSSSRDSSPLRIPNEKRNESASATAISRSSSIIKFKSRTNLRSESDDYRYTSPLSRSPSPRKKSVLDLSGEYTTPASSITSISPKSSSIDIAKSANGESLKHDKSLNSLPRRGGSVLLKRSGNIDIATSTSYQSNAVRKTPVVTAIAQQLPTTENKLKGLKGKMSGMRPGTPQPKDELWPMYKNLDSDYQKFVAKTSTLKVDEVNKTLLPFLRNDHYKNHPSTQTIRSEQLERRVNVLNKWWRAMLDMLRVHNGLSGHDRPSILEAIKRIMARQEWRFGLKFRGPPETTDRSTISGDLDSITASVYANIQKIFAQNLASQMNIVAQKISMKYAPANLMDFYGNTTAYALLFCPNIAHALLQSWKTPSDMIKRAAEALGLSRRKSSASTSGQITAELPGCMRSFCWSSAQALINRIRKPVQLPTNMEALPENGFWTRRWRGEETEYFFCFVREYYNLLDEFVSSSISHEGLAEVSGYVCVQAQIMTLVVGVVNKPPPVQDAGGKAPLLDDVLTRMASVNTSYPLSPTSKVPRPMSENRLIALLRQFLNESRDEPSHTKKAFTASFAQIMQVVAKIISVYNARACFLLCDLLEEVLPIYGIAEGEASAEDRDVTCIDWHFWHQVWEKMLESRDTVTTLRVFSLVFSLWEVIKLSNKDFSDVCLNWVLSEKVFSASFLHWAPMVRAYYMRLLLWRICEGTCYTPIQRSQIRQTISTRLKAVYAHYEAERETATKLKSAMPPSFACDPMPYHKIFIDVKQHQNQQRTPAPLLTFEDIIESHNWSQSNDKGNGSNRSTEKPPLHLPPVALAKDVSSSPPKRRWSFMGPKREEAQEKQACPSKSKSKNLDSTRQATAEARRRSQSMYGISTNIPLSAPWEPQKPVSGKKINYDFILRDLLPFMSISEKRAIARERLNDFKVLESPELPTMRHNPAEQEDIAHIAPAAIVAEGDGKEVKLGNKYAGYALAEWKNCVIEHDNWVEKRLAEGVDQVEVPRLSIDVGFIRTTKVF